MLGTIMLVGTHIRFETSLVADEPGVLNVVDAARETFSGI